jgi:hypothetical protein
MRVRTTFPRVTYLAAALLLSAACAVRAELPPVAQAAVDNGIAAAKTQDYLLAIRYFEEARKVAPMAPEIYYDLGLAESKIPGRELRAIAWFESYLAADKSATNAAAVSGQVNALDARSRDNVAKLLSSARQAAASNSRDEAFTPYFLSEVARVAAEAGNVTFALQTVDLLSSAKDKGRALKNIACAQADGGDFQGAVTNAGVIQDTYFRTSTLFHIGRLQAKAGDFSGALQTVQMMQTPDDKNSLRSTIAQAQADGGKTADALQTTESIEEPLAKGSALLDIANAQVKRRNVAGAKQTLALALKAAPLVADVSNRASLRNQIADLQVTTGDIAGAKQTLVYALSDVHLLSNSEPKVTAEVMAAIALVQVKAGDIASAQDSLRLALPEADRIQDENDKYHTKIAISHQQVDAVKVLVKTRDIVAAELIAEMIPQPDDRCGAEAEIAEFKKKAGDEAGGEAILTAARRDAMQTGDINARNQAMENIANAQIAAGDYEGALKTSLLTADDTWEDIMDDSIAQAQAKAGDIPGAQKTIGMMHYAKMKSDAQLALVSAQLKAGNVVGAQKTASLIQVTDFKSASLREIAVAQAQAGDVAAAQSTADSIQDVSYRKGAEKAVAQAQAKLSSTNRPAATVSRPTAKPAVRHPASGPGGLATPALTAADWLGKLDDDEDNQLHDCALGTDLFLNMSHSLATLPTFAENPGVQMNEFIFAVEKVVKAQNVVDRMLKTTSGEHRQYTGVQEERKRVPPNPVKTGGKNAEHGLQRLDAAALAAKRATLADEVLQHLAGLADYRDLQALYDQNATQQGWTASDEGMAISQRLAMLRSDALATTIVKDADGRVCQYSIGGIKVNDTGISPHDLEQSKAYRSTIAEAIAQNIATNPPDAKVQAALDRFRHVEK